MNRLYKILLLVLVVALAACNPTKDLKKQIEDQAPAPMQQNVKYTLTDADYGTIADMLNANKNHADSVAASKISSSKYLMGNYDHTYIPDILASVYPGLGDKSSVKVSYNYYNGPLSETMMYEAAPQYSLSNTDYESMGGAVSIYKYFSPSNPASNFVPDFLSAKYSSDTNGMVRLVKYKFANTDPAGGEMAIFDEEFAKDISLDNFTAVSVSGDQTWSASKYGATMSAYSGGANQPNEDWLVSPAIDLNGFSSPKFQISQVINFWNSTTYPDHIQILVSTDYTGNSSDLSSATWTPLSVSPMPDGSSWTEVKSDKIDLSAYAGKKIYIAFKYVSTSTDGPNWEIDWMKVYGTVSGSGSGTAPTVLSGGAYYQLSGSTWAPVSGTYYLSSADYSSFGGSIGKYGDFSSSDNPDNYLPQFLAQKYPYAQDGDEINIAYNYYSSGLHLYVDHYKYTNSMWVKYNPVTVVTSPFLNNRNTWVFNPTVYQTMTKADYQVIVDAVYANPATKDLVDPQYKDVEYYYGADAYHGNFSAQISPRETGAYAQSDYDGLSDTEATTLIYKRISEGIIVMLQHEYPNAQTQVGGVDQKYIITYDVYPNAGGSSITYKATFQCTKSGPDPQFKAVGEPEKQ